MPKKVVDSLSGGSAAAPELTAMSSALMPAEESPRKRSKQAIRPNPFAVQPLSRSVRKSAAKKPVVIYVVAPKVIEVQASEFMSMVQQLTGVESSGEIGGRRSEDRATSSKTEGLGEERSRHPAEAMREEPARLSSWKSFFANAEDSSALTAPIPNRWLLDDESSLRGKTSSPGKFIDVFCRVSPNSGD